MVQSWQIYGCPGPEDPGETVAVLQLLKVDIPQRTRSIVGLASVAIAVSRQLLTQNINRDLFLFDVSFIVKYKYKSNVLAKQVLMWKLWNTKI